MVLKPERKLIINRRKLLIASIGLIACPAIVKAGSLPLLGAGTTTSGGGGPTTLFSASPALNTNDTNVNTSFRICCPITGNSITKIRATFAASSATGFATGHCSIGKRNPAEIPLYANTLSTPLELLFSGNSGFSISSGSMITSDWSTISGFSLTTGDEAVVIFDTTTPGGQRMNNANIGVETFFKTGQPSWDIANTVGLGFSSANDTNYAIVSVETQ